MKRPLFTTNGYFAKNGRIRTTLCALWPHACHLSEVSKLADRWRGFGEMLAKEPNSAGFDRCYNEQGFVTILSLSRQHQLRSAQTNVRCNSKPTSARQGIFLVGGELIQLVVAKCT